MKTSWESLFSNKLQPPSIYSTILLLLRGEKLIIKMYMYYKYLYLTYSCTYISHAPNYVTVSSRITHLKIWFTWMKVCHFQKWQKCPQKKKFKKMCRDKYIPKWKGEYSNTEKYYCKNLNKHFLKVAIFQTKWYRKLHNTKKLKSCAGNDNVTTVICTIKKDDLGKKLIKYLI